MSWSFRELQYDCFVANELLVGSQSLGRGWNVDDLEVWCEEGLHYDVGDDYPAHLTLIIGPREFFVPCSILWFGSS